jgi:hypothetical protein
MCTALISLPKYVLTCEYVTTSNIEFVEQDKHFSIKEDKHLSIDKKKKNYKF